MTKISQQITLGDISDEYKTFVDKFKPKKTTDDCYTPDNVYQAVLDWVVETYGIDPDNVKRPFWPGGDYEAEEYQDGCVVVDNPPFSIISRICATYQAHGIKFFLFAPYMTNFSSQINGICHIITDCSIMYENGAEVNTAFLTNLEPEYEIMTAPDLRTRIVEADKVNRHKKTKTLPKYSYPPEVVTATMIGYISKYGIDFRIRRGECFFIRSLDSQKAAGKTLFGSGYLLSEKAAAEKAAAEKAAAEKAAVEKWRLSDREREIVKSLGKERR